MRAARASADRLRSRLAGHEAALAAYQGEVMYHVQVDYTCQLLDVVDEVTDPVTAALITDAIYERLTGDGVSDAAARQRQARADLERLMWERAPRTQMPPPPAPPWPYGPVPTTPTPPGS